MNAQDKAVELFKAHQSFKAALITCNEVLSALGGVWADVAATEARSCQDTLAHQTYWREVEKTLKEFPEIEKREQEPDAANFHQVACNVHEFIDVHFTSTGNEPRTFRTCKNCGADEPKREEQPEADWTVIAKTKPELEKFVLLFNGHWIGVGRRLKCEDEDAPEHAQWADETNEYITPIPTHWQPLPKKPKSAESKPEELNKSEQKKLIIDIMRGDEELGLYDMGENESREEQPEAKNDNE